METMTSAECYNLAGWNVPDYVTCAVPTDKTHIPCVNWEEWEYKADSYLSGFPSAGEQIFETLDEAKEAAVEQDDVGGITLDNLGYSLRDGSEFMYSPVGEESWLKPATPCPKCVDFENWEFADDSYLAGLASDNGRFYVTLEDAQLNALRYHDARGVTEGK